MFSLGRGGEARSRGGDARLRPYRRFALSGVPSIRRLFADLKRRQVFKVAAVYGAAAFAALQGADVLVPALHLPEAVTTTIAVVILVGFPVALALAWAYERTPQGVKRTEAAGPGELTQIVSLPAARRWPAGIAALAGTALLAAGGWWVLRGSDDRVPDSNPPSQRATDGAAVSTRATGDRDDPAAVHTIAVLPFVNMSRDPDNEYFSDGLTEELINALTAIDGLRVTARTSAFAFKGKDEDVREIGEALGVQNVLEGSVRRAGDQVRITAQLVQARDGFHLWSESYDRRLTDIFALQEEIATAIAERLELTLTAEGRSSLARRRTEDLEAYDLYLLGRHNWATRSDTGLIKARAYFEAAIAQDSTYAPAWAGLAAVYNALPWYVYDEYPPREAAEKSKAAARRAIALDPGLAAAHATLAVTLQEYDWDWAEAEAHYQRALALDPNDAQTLDWYCTFLLVTGRLREGVASCRRALIAEPLSDRYAWDVGYALAVNDSLDAAMPYLERGLTTGIPEVVWDIGVRYLTAGLYAHASETLETWLADEGFERPERIRAVVDGIADPARRAEAVAALDQLMGEERVGPLSWVVFLAELSEMERAVALLSAQVEAGDPAVHSVGVDPMYDALRRDPRFIQIVKRLGVSNGRGSP